MNERKAKVLNSILATDEWITANQLATITNVSPRTIKSYVKDINEHFPNAVIIASNQGYKITNSNKEKLKEEYKLAHLANVQNIILGKLLVNSNQQESFLDVYKLATEMKYSEQFIRNKLSKLKVIVNQYNLELKHQKSKYWLVGSERDKRKLQSQLLYQELNLNFIDEQIISKFFPKINGSLLKVMIKQELEYHKQYMNTFLLNTALLHLAILIDRCQKQPKLAKCKTILSSQFIDFLENEYQISLQQADLDEIVDILDLDSKQFAVNIETIIKADAVEQLLANIEMYVPFKFEDQNLKKRMANHLENFYFRAKNNKVQKNPMKELIKIRSPLVYEAAYYALMQFCKKYNLVCTDDEVGFIAIHIGLEIEFQNKVANKIVIDIYCPSYFGLGMELKNKLEKHLDNDMYVRHIYEQEPLENKINDAILVSLVKLSFQAKHVVIISPFLTSIDLKHVAKEITMYKNDLKRSALMQMMSELADERYFWQIDKPLTKDEALKMMYNKLLDNQLIDFDFCTNVDEREQLSSTAFNLVALPHALEYDANQSVIAILVNYSKIKWSDDTVQIIMLLVTKSSDKKIFIDLFEILSNFFEDTILQARLTNVSSLEQFILELVNGIK